MEKYEQEQQYTVELSLLKSDLSSMFFIHEDESAVYQPDDMTASAELILAGSYNFDDAPLDISISQRIDQNNIVNFLLLYAVESYDHYWCFIDDKKALMVSGELCPMTLENIVDVRAMISEDHAIWNRELSESIVNTRVSSPYDWIEKIYGRPPD